LPGPDKEEVQQEQDATYIRKISYQSGKPYGLVRDYYAKTNVLQWDGKLVSERPEVRQGTSITYNEKGLKVEEATYKDGQLAGQVRRWGMTARRS
jgi:antitoxin component YwqK of YwqJK toxin-antitoxin module